MTISEYLPDDVTPPTPTDGERLRTDAETVLADWAARNGYIPDTGHEAWRVAVDRLAAFWHTHQVTPGDMRETLTEQVASKKIGTAQIAYSTGTRQTTLTGLVADVPALIIAYLRPALTRRNHPTVYG